MGEVDPKRKVLLKDNGAKVSNGTVAAGEVKNETKTNTKLIEKSEKPKPKEPQKQPQKSVAVHITGDVKPNSTVAQTSNKTVNATQQA